MLSFQLRAMCGEIKNEAGATPSPSITRVGLAFLRSRILKKFDGITKTVFIALEGIHWRIFVPRFNLGLCSAHQVQNSKSGKFVRYAGLVICRQRPGTAGGVVFLTLEDETGFVNVVVWQNVFEKYSILAKTASFLGVSGKLQ